MENPEETTPGRMMVNFITDQIFSLTLMATSQRSHIYGADSNEDARGKFRRDLRRLLEESARAYSQQVSPEQHLQNIQNLANELSFNHENCLRDGRFRIGLAQKALNLYLKYLWCLGRIPEPPHCPIDRIVLGKTECRHCKSINWTTMDSIEVYSQIVEHVSEVATRGGLTLATWELEIWADAKDRSP